MSDEAKTPAVCGLCGFPMPKGEEMFKYHGYSGDCPSPALKRPGADTIGMKAMDEAAAKVAKNQATRVSLADLDNEVHSVYYLNGREAVETMFPATANADERRALSCLTLCLVVCKNGFVLVGKSAAADPQNYNEEMGKKAACEDAMKQLWPLLGYQMRTKLAQDSENVAKAC